MFLKEFQGEADKRRGKACTNHWLRGHGERWQVTRRKAKIRYYKESAKGSETFNSGKKGSVWKAKGISTNNNTVKRRERYKLGKINLGS